MLNFQINHQEQYSRGELLLRTFFGWLYIVIPHYFLLVFYSIWLLLLSIGAWFVILFTGNTPQWYYEVVLKVTKWTTRLTARTWNLSDGYPSFGPEGADDSTTVDFPLENIGRGKLLLISFFGILYAGIPHLFCLYFRILASSILTLIAWFAVLFTGKYPADMHAFNVGTLRWLTRVNLYLSFLSNNYPPFSGK